MEEKKVSVIVAIYMVSKYLRECVDSIVGQTYKNLEIILVVGRKDVRSVEIAMDYSFKDDRIKLAFVEPKGVAAARNEGLDKATGDLIAFVDGDDYIEKDMIETMVHDMDENDADISIVGKYQVFENVKLGTDEGETEVLNSREIFKTILKNDRFFLHLWDKLYKKEMFDGVRFEEGAIVEDRQFCANILAKTRKAVYNPKGRYYFRQSSDSSSKLLKNVNDSLREDYIICNMILEMHPDLNRFVDRFLLVELMSGLQSLFLYKAYTKESALPYRNEIKAQVLKLKDSDILSRNLKIKAFLAVHMPRILGLVTVHDRKVYLKKHIPFKSGNDWEKLFKEQGLNV